MNSIFKTGTFGFSTVLSTPCDYAADGTPICFSNSLNVDYFNRTQKKQCSLANDLLYEVSSQSQKGGRSYKSAITLCNSLTDSS